MQNGINHTQKNIHITSNDFDKYWSNMTSVFLYKNKQKYNVFHKKISHKNDG